VSDLVRVYHGTNPIGAGAFRLDSRADFDEYARYAVGMRKDAGLSRAFARQLEHIMAKTYEAEFAEYRATEFFPVNTELGPGDMTFTYRMIERIGNAAVINAGNAKDLPNIDVGASEWPSPIITLGASYNFTVIDQAAGAKANIAIEAEKAKATREAVEGLEEQIWASGYAGTGVPGVTNAVGVQAVPQTSTGTWQAQLKVALATPPTSTVPYPAVGAVTAIASDIIAAKQQIFSQTIARQKATNCLLPPNLYSMLDTAPQSPAINSKTLLTFLEELTGLDIDYWPILQNIGSIPGSTASIVGTGPTFNTRVMVYDKDPDVVQLMMSQPFVQLAPQAVGLVWEVPVFSRIGGAMAVRPAGIVYIDGLGTNVAGKDLDGFYDGKDANCLGVAPCGTELDGVMAGAY
jgi:hypothetical protein